jgi:NAD(P)-dependent dehydrogenase (short-subunit alcohol dehydrogenase family)
MKGLTGKIALVTGGLGDLGYASIVRLVEEGCRVASFDLKADTAGKLAALGVFHQAVDISDETAVKTACVAIREKLGPVAILVNCAARFIFRSVDATPAEWHDILSVNIVGTTLVTQNIVPQMKAAGGGSIITLGGMTALSGAKKRVHGSVGKHGLWGMTRALAKELGEHRINVNCVAPGQMDTARAADRSERAPVTNVPMGRRSTPEEVAGIVRYLCTPAGRMISGQLIYVDGGQQMF